MWNESWRQFVRAHQSKPQVPQEVIWRHAFQLMVQYNVTGPFVSYR